VLFPSTGKRSPGAAQEPRSDARKPGSQGKENLASLAGPRSALPQGPKGGEANWPFSKGKKQEFEETCLQEDVPRLSGQKQTPDAPNLVHQKKKNPDGYQGRRATAGGRLREPTDAYRGEGSRTPAAQQGPVASTLQEKGPPSPLRRGPTRSHVPEGQGEDLSKPGEKAKGSVQKRPIANCPPHGGGSVPTRRRKKTKQRFVEGKKISSPATGGRATTREKGGGTLKTCGKW